MNDLVERLAQGDHAVALGGPVPQLAELQERIAHIGYVFIKFTDTHGGTDLGVRIDSAATTTAQADFTHATGTIHIEGTLTLDFVPVRCVADLDLRTLTGTGHLIVQQPAQT